MIDPVPEYLNHPPLPPVKLEKVPYISIAFGVAFPFPLAFAVQVDAPLLDKYLRSVAAEKTTLDADGVSLKVTIAGIIPNADVELYAVAKQIG